ncbi:MAG: Jag N-terminal domain-containing protein [Microthrixaceae bacterium]
MEWIELTGKTIDEAREKALDRLGVHESEAEVEVLEHPSVSMFGRVKTEARVRARVQPVAAPPKEQRRRKGGSQGGDQQASKPKRRDGSQSSSKSQGESGTGGGGNNGRRERGGKGRDQGRERSSVEDSSVDPMTAPEVASTVEEFLSGLMAAAGRTVETSSELDGDRVDVTVVGDDLGVMVGHGGATADAVLELSKAVMLKTAKGGTDVRLGVDVAGYRGIRRAALEEYGTDLAQRVVESGEDVVLEPMGSIDRKIVHDAANSVEGVETESTGQGRDRRVVIRASA